MTITGKKTGASKIRDRILADSSATSFAEHIDNTLTPLSDFVSSIIFYSIDVFGVSLPLVVIWLMAAAVILTFSLRFINLRGFRHAVSLITNPRDHDGASGEISHFQALSSALSGTVGLGNIASVPVAIAIGGPGAVFWMILAGFFGMSSKFAECALAVKYRKVRPDGTTLGGPMFYIEEVFNRLNLKMLGKAAAIFFAVMTIGASVSVFQVNQAYAQFANVFGYEQLESYQRFVANTHIDAAVIFGVIMASGVAYVVLGGIKRIGKVTGILVPAMGAVYLGAGLLILLINAPAIPAAFATIFKGAFGLDAAGGGFIGALINGMRRATYSNEAGVGSAAIAHSAVKTNDPLTEGYVALLEPFIDTVVVCTVTALVVIVTGAYIPHLYQDNVVGIEITSAAYESVFAWFPYILLVASMLFAFTTLVSWAFYGAQAAAYLFGDSKRTDVLFKVCLCIALSTGAAISLSSIINFTDSMLFGMCIPNIIALYFLLPELKRDVKVYEAKHRLS